MFSRKSNYVNKEQVVLYMKKRRKNNMEELQDTFNEDDLFELVEGGLIENADKN